jgi:hypothetical protein
LFNIKNKNKNRAPHLHFKKRLMRNREFFFLAKALIMHSFDKHPK